MKRIQYHQHGGPEVMALEDFRPSRTPLGEVLGRGALKASGAFAEMVLASAKAVAKKPENLALAQGPFRVLTTHPNAAHLEQVARAASEGHLQLSIARTAPSSDAITAISEFEKVSGPKGGKFVVTMP